jgi:hypothetical protein
MEAYHVLPENDLREHEDSFTYIFFQYARATPKRWTFQVDCPAFALATAVQM